MILRKEYVSLKTAAMKMGIDISTVITATVVKRKKALHWVIPCYIIQSISFLPQACFLKFLPVVSIIEM